MRLSDWPTRLGRVWRDCQGKPLIWGEHDCFLHAGAVAEALTGVDPTRAMRGGYASYAEGLRLARRLFGVSGLAGFADAHFTRTPFAKAQRGDWALVSSPEAPGGRPRPALAIVEGGAIRDAWGAMWRLSDAETCWSIDGREDAWPS